VNVPATVGNKLIALSAAGLQTLQSSGQRGHYPLSAYAEYTVETDGAGSSPSSHSLHSMGKESHP
jgi:hypothetical protein